MKNKRNIYGNIIRVCIILFICFIYLHSLYRLLTGNVENVAIWLLAMVYSSYLFAGIWMEVQVGARECKIAQEGICVKYLLSNEKLLPWEQFQQICVCFEPVKRRYIPPRFTDQEIICFVLRKAKKDSWGFWNIYSKKYFREILFIAYSEESLKELQEYCPMQIVDLRTDNVYQNR